MVEKGLIESPFCVPYLTRIKNNTKGDFSMKNRKFKFTVWNAAADKCI